MPPITTTGKLLYGLHVNGLWHKEFEMRLATLEDVECAIEEAGEGASPARISRHKWARTLIRLGALTEKDITPELLADLASTEYGILSAEEDALLKKLAAASAAPAGTSV